VDPFVTAQNQDQTHACAFETWRTCGVTMTLSSASKRWVLLVTLLVYLDRGREGHPSAKKLGCSHRVMVMSPTPYPGVIKASPGSFSKHDFSADRSISSWQAGRNKTVRQYAGTMININAPVRPHSPLAVGFARVRS
jgi:hypothetical protein